MASPWNIKRFLPCPDDSGNFLSFIEPFLLFVVLGKDTIDDNLMNDLIVLGMDTWRGIVNFEDTIEIESNCN